MELLLFVIGTPVVLLGSLLGMDWLEQGLGTTARTGKKRASATGRAPR